MARLSNPILVTSEKGRVIVLRSIHEAATMFGCCEQVIRIRINSGRGFVWNGNQYFFDYALKEEESHV